MKWVKIKLRATITKYKATKFLWKNIIYYFDFLRVLAIDNEKQFYKKKFRGICEELSIDLRFTSVIYLQTNE